MTLIGEAVFSVEKKGRWYDINLEPGDIVVFDREVRHKAGGARGPRVNVTTRYGLEGSKRMFIWPKWYHPQGTGITKQPGRCNDPPE